jgi:hypothetical protein
MVDVSGCGDMAAAELAGSPNIYKHELIPRRVDECGEYRRVARIAAAGKQFVG